MFNYLSIFSLGTSFLNISSSNIFVTNPHPFENAYKEHISAHYAKADNTLKDGIMSIEDKLKLSREEELKGFFIETCQANEVDFVTFDKVGLNITMSPSMKSYREKISSFVEDIAKETKLIDTLDTTDNYKIDVLVEYKNCLNLTESIRIIKARRETREAVQEKRNAAPTVVEEKPVAPAPVEEIPLQAPTVETPEEVYEMNFSVKGTLPKLKALKAFLIENEIEFKNID